MKRFYRAALAACVAAAACPACVTGRVINMPGGLARPVSAAAESPEGPLAAVFDFDFARKGEDPQEIGRDFDTVRAILWKGEPGKAVADLVAAAISERGIPAVRVGGEGAVPPDAAARVAGTVEEFRVSARRLDFVKVEYSARVAVSLSVVFRGAQAPWTTRVSASATRTDALFVTPEGIREAVNDAANAAADEAAARFGAAGLSGARPSGTDKPAAGGKEGGG